MVKNIIIAVLALIIIFETGYIVAKKVTTKVTSEIAEANPKVTQPNPPPNRPAPVFLTKGATLSASPVFKYAYLMAPGTLSADTKAALVGWTIASKSQPDSSLVVTLTPKDSDDQFQSYTIKSGEKLYFIETTPADDVQDQDVDKNLRDDYGVIVDENGIVQ